MLPFPDEAAAWFVDTARAALRAGGRLDVAAVRLLMSLAPGDPAIGAAIDTMSTPPPGLATQAREAVVRLREALAARDDAAARETVSALEAEVVRVYRPARGLDGFADDAAVALAMIAAYDVGADETHLMMAEELMLGVLRREWAHRGRHDMGANCDAAVALSALAARTGKAEYRDRALEVMNGYAATYRAHGVGAAPYVAALLSIRPSATRNPEPPPES